MESFNPFGQISITILPSTTSVVEIEDDEWVPTTTSTPPFPGRLQRQIAAPTTFGFPLTSENRESEHVGLSRSTSNGSAVSHIESLPPPRDMVVELERVRATVQLHTLLRENPDWMRMVEERQNEIPFMRSNPPLERARRYEEVYPTERVVSINYDDPISSSFGLEERDVFLGLGDNPTSLR